MEVTFNTVYKEQYNNVLKYCKFKTNNIEIAEDIAAEIFIKVHNKLGSYQPDKSAIGTWVMNIAKNSVIDFWRSNKYNDLVHSMNDFEDEEGHNFLVHTDESNPQTDLENKEIGEKIHKAIESLSDEYKTVANKFLIQQYSYDEIAKDLDIPLGTVKGTIHRIREILQNRLLGLK